VSWKKNKRRPNTDIRIEKLCSNPKSFVNFLLPPRGFGEGWGGVKNLRLL